MSRDQVPPRLRKLARSAPLLDAESELECLERVRESDDPQAMATLVSSHLRLALAAATRYAGRGVQTEDLVSEGVLGLCEAARRFDPERKTRFSTYASWWVRAHVRAFALKNRRLVALPSTRSARVVIGRAARTEHELTGRLGRPPSHEELARALGVATRDVETVSAALGARDVSLTALPGGPAPRLVAQASDPEEEAAAREEREQARASVHGALQTLDERELEIVRRRYLVGEIQTLRSIGADMGLSRERIRQLELRAKGKLRRALARVA